jgi:hypothetical protein
MFEAMERSLRVNAGSDSDVEPGRSEGFRWPSVDIHGQWQPRPLPVGGTAAGDFGTQPAGARFAPNGSAQADQGPCLYLGPAGQRCDRRAAKDGFCAHHQPGAPVLASPIFTPKKVAAFLMALAILWPELARLLGALARLFR